ncbi:MAG: hypothetical protein GXO88_02145, partial [Chlorobi bacterium]|nr:hypothetical protein [Chlorobiota bacterium]
MNRLIALRLYLLVFGLVVFSYEGVFCGQVQNTEGIVVLKVPGSVSSGKKKALNVNFRKEPYLIFTAQADEVQVLWQLKTTENCKVQWGTDLTYSLGNDITTEYGNFHQHKYTFIGLEAETVYYYRVIASPDTVSGKFVSAPAATKTQLTFFAYGDTRTHPSHHDDVAAQILAEIENDAEALTFIVSSGDFVSDGNKESDWDSQFFDEQYSNIRKMMQKLPYLGSMGNHEGNGLLFAKYFPYPFYSGSDYYWSFDYGPAHFAVVDQFTDYTPGSDQYSWLENDLAGTQKQWKFILLHKPGWSAGGGHSNNSDVQDYIQPLCVQYGVQMVIGGHNHYYSCAVVDDVVHVTAGGGGAPLYNPDASSPNIIKVSKTYNFCKITLDENDLQLLAISDNGDVIHQFSYNDLVSSVDGKTLDGIEGLLVFPNPFKDTASLEFELKNSGIYKISVYDASGKFIKLIRDARMEAGKHKITWDGT